MNTDVGSVARRVAHSCRIVWRAQASGAMAVVEVCGWASETTTGTLWREAASMESSGVWLKMDEVDEAKGANWTVRSDAGGGVTVSQVPRDKQLPNG